MKFKKDFFQNLFVRPLDWGSDASNLSQSLLDTCGEQDEIDALQGAVKSAQRIAGFEGFAPLVYDVFLNLEEEVSWAAYVKSQLLSRWFDSVLSGFPVLRQFSHSHLNNRLELLQELEGEHRSTSRLHVRETWRKGLADGLANSAGVRLLNKEANKKRRVLTPREIMEKGALDAMLSLKPIWLMSPLSISQILPLESGLFDYIIFDEASQVRVEDSLPSIYRANSLFVVGDQKQMPPTNFFSLQLEEDEEDELDEIPESILDLALQVYPHVLLEWHYRSKAEALIAFSNRAFYEGRLVAPPNPRDFASNSPIEFIRVNDGTFTTRSGNRKEAELVVDKVAELLQENVERSLGVMTLGQSQMKLIDEVLLERAENDEAFRKLLDRSMQLKDGEADIGFFVKNLENVQGDEREVILISVGYAPSRLGRKLVRNFGPLSKMGGARRLNVAVTRAKRKILVFCSFEPSEIAIDERAYSKNPDLTTFGRYLHYAKAVSDGETGRALSVLDLFGDSKGAEFRSGTLLAKEIKANLESRGYHVHLDVGACGYFIDLAVSAPELGGGYVLGIECDGPSMFAPPIRSR